MKSAIVRKPRRIRVVAGLLMMVGVLAAAQYAGTPAARASSSRAGAPAASAVPAQGPLSEVCSYQGSKSLCANRQGGATSAGTFVIGWSAGSANNDFSFGYLTGMCNGGRVTVSPPCPFSGNGDLNDRYNGKVIAMIYNWASGLCVADSGTGSGATVLDKCPNVDGAGGADGTIFVLAQATNPLNAPPVTYVVNRYWSNFTGTGGGKGTSPRWLCVISKGLFLVENSSSGDAGSCQWNEI
jgi:hypothetical protein